MPEDSKHFVKGQQSPETKKIRDRALKYKQEHPDDPNQKLTPLQQRMQSGGAGIIEKRK